MSVAMIDDDDHHGDYGDGDPHIVPCSIFGSTSTVAALPCMLVLPSHLFWAPVVGTLAGVTQEEGQRRSFSALFFYGTRPYSCAPYLSFYMVRSVQQFVSCVDRRVEFPSVDSFFE